MTDTTSSEIPFPYRQNTGMNGPGFLAAAEQVMTPTRAPYPVHLGHQAFELLPQLKRGPQLGADGNPLTGAWLPGADPGNLGYPAIEENIDRGPCPPSPSGATPTALILVALGALVLVALATRRGDL